MRLGLIGDPVGHSRSPQMMHAAFAHMGLTASYEAIAVSKESLSQDIRQDPIVGWDGFNVTIPHKVGVMGLLDDLDESARTIGAVNTVVVRDRTRIGYNTDGVGYLRSLEQETGITVNGQSVVILGAGGAARAVATILAKEGIAQIQILNRTYSKAEELASHLGRWTTANACSLEDGKETICQASLLINTTSIGMYPNVDRLPIPEEWIFPHLLVSDLIYNPKETLFIQKARQKGCPVHYGLGMLVHQAAHALELWTGQKAPVEVMWSALEKALIVQNT
ncbi:shikimate dehydrogenase [Thermoactinomyces sp. DSM 45891]|uniref:shikimate dehydrogenase n=1 Tax=Thermoactinomyces sp. DSM 45891 TaxID=1761907 RepID=UPI0009245779|nr:shikimate dehydrogenase [Thermoactinomyces sp. DSM 45891]SFX54042.1 shikimate dehydrogenase [Thermoactinomyces sp. DSM 45891]